VARRRSLALAGLAVLVSGMLPGCGGGTEDPDDGSAAPASETPTSDSSPSETAPAPEPTEETPEVEPADGPVLQVGSYSVSAPARFRVNNDTTFADSAFGPVGDGRTGGVVLGVYAADQLSLDEAMRRSWRPDRTKPPGFEEQPTTVLGSRTAYYYTAPDGSTVTDHVMGMWDGAGLVELRVDLPNAMPAERQREIVESIRLTYSSTS
jgi:hypothetical protein